MQISVSFIGAGRVATQLANALLKSVSIKQIFNRNLEKAQQLASQVNAQAIDDLKLLIDSDLLIISVSDQAIADIADQLAAIQYKGLVIHTSGSTDIEVLKKYGLRAGVLYPLQTFSFDKVVDWQTTPIFIEAVSEQDLEFLRQIAQMLSQSTYLYNSEQRLSLHLAAVFACNFSNYCYDIAQQLLDQQQVDPSLLQPLIAETASKLQLFSAFQNQTGPAKRHDQNILQLHHHMLSNNPEWQEIYQIMSKAIETRHS